MKPTIAVITPCYNGEKFIADCIASVQASKTFGLFDIEHIIVDDGSTDGSWEIISAFNYPNLKKFRFKKNKGLAATRNFAISKTKAYYIFWLDADDVIFQNTLRYFFEESVYTGASWAYSDVLRTDSRLRYQIENDYYGSQFKTPGQAITSMLCGEHFFQHNGLFTKELFESVNGYDKPLRFGEDYGIALRFLMKKVLPVHLRSPLIINRNHGTSMSQEYKKDTNLIKKDLKKLFEVHSKELKKLLTPQQIEKITNYLGL